MGKPLGRVVGKVYFAHEICLGGRHLSVLAVVVSTWAFWNFSCHLGSMTVTIPRRTLRRVEGLWLLWHRGYQVLEVPISRLPIVGARNFLESLTCLELDFLFTFSQKPF